MGDFESTSRLVRTAGEICLLDCLDDARDDLCELMKRWNERLTFEDAILWEEYAKGRLAIVCYVQLGIGSNCIQYPSGVRAQRKVSESVVVIVVRANAGHLNNANRWNKQSMLVNYVDFVEGTDGVISSDVWLYDINYQIADVLPRDLYFSTIDSCYKFLPRLPDGEVAILGRGTTSDGNNLAGRKIKSGPKVMNSIPEDEGDAFRQRLGIEPQYISTCKISIDANTASASFKEGDEGSVQLIDVLVGPFNL
jgi:hypothetical protein